MLGYLRPKRLSEFWEGDDGRLSMMRLTVFMSFWPASWVLINNSNDMTLGVYLTAYVGGFVGGKTTDIFMHNKSGKNARTPAK